MIDSWNAAKLNERITQVEKKIQANDVIANPTGAATTDLSKISIDGTIYGTSVVKPNPASEATADLSKISIDGTVYGTSVVKANPVGEATGELSKISVDGTVYSTVPGILTFSNSEEVALTSGSFSTIVGSEDNISAGTYLILITYTIKNMSTSSVSIPVSAAINTKNVFIGIVNQRGYEAYTDTYIHTFTYDGSTKFEGNFMARITDVIISSASATLIKIS